MLKRSPMHTAISPHACSVDPTTLLTIQQTISTHPKKQTPNTHPIMHLNTQIAQNTPVHMYPHTTKNSPALSHSSKHNHTPTYPKINISTLQYQFRISY